MNKLPAPSEHIRTTFNHVGKDELPCCGIYIIAYMGRIIYVGKTTSGIESRLQNHLYNREHELLGAWLSKNSDWHNIRLDIFIPPDSLDIVWWLREVEAAYIQQTKPLFNTNLNKDQYE